MIVAYISFMMFSTALVEGRYKSIAHEFAHDLIPNIKTSYKASAMGLMWLQLISFYWLPMKLRVLAVNFIDIIWVVVMSFVTHLHRHWVCTVTYLNSFRWCVFKCRSNHLYSYEGMISLREKNFNSVHQILSVLRAGSSRGILNISCASYWAFADMQLQALSVLFKTISIVNT